MSWLLLLIIGVVLLAISYAPMPPPVPIIFRWLGMALLIIAGIVLLVALLGGTASTVEDPVHTVEVD